MGDIWGLSKMSLLDAFRFSTELTSGKRHQPLFYLLSLGPSGLMLVYLFSICLSALALFVHVLFSPLHEATSLRARLFVPCIFISLRLTIALDMRKGVNKCVMNE